VLLSIAQVTRKLPPATEALPAPKGHGHSKNVTRLFN
jgi:hypothetical protein